MTRFTKATLIVAALVLAAAAWAWLVGQAYIARGGFPVVVIGNRVKIPKEGFLNFCRGQKTELHALA